ncbi:MAG: hypothetical protein BRD31_03290 [Bacteroidetes bacterium QH_2_64_26]|nr:MAG: hypothetical protein BRD31_03290 [Bacteroidetes bacterium QH_2_64_26]
MKNSLTGDTVCLPSGPPTRPRLPVRAFPLAVRRGHEHLDVFPNHLLGVVAEDLLGGLVERLDRTLRVDRDDAVDGRIEGSSGSCVALARQYEATLHALHVVDSLPYVALASTDRLSLGNTPLSEHRGRRRLQSFHRERDAADVRIRAHLAYRDAVDKVARFVGRKDIDLLVLASHGGNARSHEVPGDGTERVLGRVTCPVFLCRAFGTSLLAPASDRGRRPFLRRAREICRADGRRRASPLP